MNEELPLNEAPRWTVVPVLGRDPERIGKKKLKAEQPVIIRHDLRYGSRRMEKGFTDKEVERLREMAKLFNSKGAEPKDIRRDGSVQLQLWIDPQPEA